MFKTMVPFPLIGILAPLSATCFDVFCTGSKVLYSLLLLQKWAVAVLSKTQTVLFAISLTMFVSVL